jgi:cell division GTPase FtsZ
MSQQINLICVDFNDVVLLMRSGRIGRMGIGVARGKEKNEIATQTALNELKCDLAKANSTLVILRDGKKLSVENYDKAAAVLYPQIQEEKPFIMGLVHDDSVESRVEVTVLCIESNH